jgi:hypothetical protein
MHAQHLVGGPLEGDRPAMVAEAKVLRGGVAVQVACHRLGHDEREDARLAAVVQLAESVQERHLVRAFVVRPTEAAACVLASIVRRPPLSSRPPKQALGPNAHTHVTTRFARPSCWRLPAIAGIHFRPPTCRHTTHFLSLALALG